MLQEIVTCTNCSRMLNEQDRIVIDQGDFTNAHPTYVYTCPHCGHIEACHGDYQSNEDSIPS